MFAQELMLEFINRVACKAWGPRVNPTLQLLFEGELTAPAPGLNVDSSSQWEKTFCYLMLDMTSGSLEASLDHLFGGTRTEGHGKQDAECRMRIVESPPVLTFHLKRFNSTHKPLSDRGQDHLDQDLIKDSQRFEFPTLLDLSPYMSKAKRDPGETGDTAEDKGTEEMKGAPEEEPEEESYCLHSVLVHSGDAHVGRYYAYIRPPGLPEGGDWLKYEDGTVSLVWEAEALEDSYGPKPPGECDEASTMPAGGHGTGGRMDQPVEQPALSKVAGCAYMLVYIRERDLPVVLRESVPEQSVPEDPSPQLKSATPLRLQLRHQLLLHQCLGDPQQPSVVVELVTKKDVANFSCYTATEDFAYRWDVHPALMMHQPEQLRIVAVPIKKSEPVAAVMLHVKQELGIPLYRQRLWVISQRQSKRWRVTQPLSHFRPSSNHLDQQGLFLDTVVGDLQREGDLRLYVEELPDPQLLSLGGHEPDWLDTDGTISLDWDGVRGEKRRRRQAMLHDAEEVVQNCDDVLAFLKTFPPPPVPRDSIFLFFKKYDKRVEVRPPRFLTDPSIPRPLQFQLARLVSKSQTVRSLVAKLRKCVPGLPKQDKHVEVYVEVTPHRVKRLSLHQTLEQLKLKNGDIICIQRASAAEDVEEKYYNTPSLPHHVPAYFSYLMDRRVAFFKPRTYPDMVTLRWCTSFIEQSGLEHMSRCSLLRDKAGKGTSVQLELSWRSTYRSMQEALCRWLQPVVQDPLRLRIVPRYGKELTDQQLAAEGLLLDHLLRSGNAYVDEDFFFEIRPLAVRTPTPFLSMPCPRRGR
jgi:hypothetical protein